MRGINERKRRVAELMTVGGLSKVRAAERVGVSSNTVNRWLRRDPEFREQVRGWCTGVPMDGVRIAQSRRAVMNELARRVLHERSKLTIRDLLSIHDLLMKETEAMTKENEENDDGDDTGLELTPEQAERIWAEVDRESRSAEEGAPGEQTQP